MGNTEPNKYQKPIHYESIYQDKINNICSNMIKNKCDILPNSSNFVFKINGINYIFYIDNDKNDDNIKKYENIFKEHILFDNIIIYYSQFTGYNYIMLDNLQEKKIFE